jgi:hypothetical protein
VADVPQFEKHCPGGYIKIHQVVPNTAFVKLEVKSWPLGEDLGASPTRNVMDDVRFKHGKTIL